MNFNIITDLTTSEIKFLSEQITNYNLSKIPPTDNELFKKINLIIKYEKGEILAGLLGEKYYMNAAHIDTLWVDENFRGIDLGTNLLAKFEEIVKNLNCFMVHLDTFDFQAPKFYEKNGYKLYGTLNDNPIGHKRFYYYKILG